MTGNKPLNSRKPEDVLLEEVMDKKEYYTVEEFAKVLRVHQKTISRWILEGKLAFWQIENSRTIRIPHSELVRHISPLAVRKEAVLLERNGKR